MNNKVIRVAVLGTRGIPDIMGGVETHCQALYPHLAAKGHKITLFARSGYVASTHPYNFQGVRVITLWAPRQKNLEAIVHTTIGVLKVFLNRSSFDILHIHSIGPSLLIPIARICGIKVVMTHHGADYHRQKWGRLAKLMLILGESFGCKFAHSIIGVSRYISAKVESRFCRKCAYIPNGVALPELVPPGNKLIEHELIAGKYIFTVGRFVPEKGFHDLIEAFNSIESDWKLVIAGAADHQDQYSQSLQKMAKGNHRVVLTGFIHGKELAELYSNAGLFVLPSYHEGLPIVLLEALSYNLPILATNIPSNRELVPDDSLYPAGNVDILRSRIIQFIAFPVKGSNGRETIAREFNWDQVAECTEAVYRDVL